MYLGNIPFNQVRSITGFELTSEDRKLWDKFNNPKADLSGMKSCFHFFLFPTLIIYKGDEAKEAILEIFRPEKQVEQICEIEVRVQRG